MGTQWWNFAEHSHSKSASCLRGNSTRETPSMMKVLLLVGLACLLVACQARPASEDELRKLMKEVIEDELKEELLAELEELEGQDDKRLPKDGSKPLAQERRKLKDSQDERKPRKGKEEEWKEDGEEDDRKPRLPKESKPEGGERPRPDE